MRIPVLTAGGGASWESALVAALDDGAHPIAVSRRCVDVVDLLAIAAAGQGQAALVEAELRDFDADAVDRLRACGVIPIAVVDPAESMAAATLRARGVQFTVPADADPAVVASVVRSALADLASERERPTAVRREFSNPVGVSQFSPGAAKGSANAAAVRRASRDRGRLVAVWGPTGAPGRTTVAVGIADELARLGAPTLLIDADVYGGTVAAVLGILDESPGLAAACRIAGRSGLDPDRLADVCWQLRPSMRVLTGIPLAQRWPEVRPSALVTVLDTARSLAQHVVVDCGFGLEADEETSYDTLAPRRNGATLTVLDAADVIVAVGAADPVGIQRLVRGLDDLRDTGCGAPVHVVVNRARPTLFRGDARTELAAALSRLTGRQPDTVLPEDRESLDAALAAGRSLAELSPGSALRRGLMGLAGSVAGVEVPPARHRRKP